MMLIPLDRCRHLPHRRKRTAARLAEEMSRADHRGRSGRGL
jgi:hypothetical protein